MKFVFVVCALALAMAGVGVACGPEEKYCFDEHKTCAQAKLDKAAKEQEIKDAIEKARREAEAGEGNTDGGATVVGQ
ncbi:MAG: hypothetical protein ABUS79_06585 [Pseudomonadota bacterium]